MIDIATARDLGAELAELDTEARAWFADGGADDHAALARALPRLLASSRVELDRPDRCDLFAVRVVSGLPPTWGDAQTFACIALAALQCAGDELAAVAGGDEAYALRYLSAGRDALRLAELTAAAKAGPRAATERREADAFERLQDFAQAWRELGDLLWKEKVGAVVQRMRVSEKTVERWHADAVRLGLPLDPRA